jgi:hypothetical protein
VERNHRRVVPFEHDEVQSVLERELGNGLFEGGEILRGRGMNYRQEGKNQSQGGVRKKLFHMF